MTVETTGQQEVTVGTEQPTQPQVDEVEQQSSPESEAQAEPTPKAEKPAVDPVQKRINQLTWEKHERDRRLNAEAFARQAAEQRAAQLEWQMQEVQRRMTAPTLEQFNFDPQAYQRAVDQHTAQHLEQQRRAMESQVQARQQAQAQEQFNAALNARVAAAEQKYPDFAEVVMGNPSLPPLQSVNPVLFNAIVDHDQFSDIAYYLGKNEGEAHRIAAMPPLKAVIEVGKIAAKLSAAPRQTSQAPAPPAQVSGRSAGTSKDPAHMTRDEYYAHITRGRGKR